MKILESCSFVKLIVAHFTIFLVIEAICSSVKAAISIIHFATLLFFIQSSVHRRNSNLSASKLPFLKAS